LVLVGVGKSGNVATKLAATCASLGIHSFYVHATEAAHGGLGSISWRDVVLLISHSGKTEEVLDILASLKFTGCKTVAICGNDTSRLAQSVDINICYGEADPHGLAPTCSTAVAMAVGDALTVTISSMRGFSRWDFGKRHPGGALGQTVLGATFAQLTEYDQTHLLDHFTTLSAEEKLALQCDIQKIDLPPY
jgi:KpsF/GutQ family protein